MEERNVIRQSLVDAGNNERAKALLGKLDQGKEATALFVGGSVTEGYQVEKGQAFPALLKECGNIKIINDGLAGTDSLCGLMRSGVNVAKRPDVVCLEYAVNDRKASLYRKAFESLVATYLECESKPLVILLLLKSKVGYACQGHMQQIGWFYQLPIINVGSLLSDDFQAGAWRWEEYSGDEVHPNPKGHRLIADCLLHYMEAVRGEGPSTEFRMPLGSRYGTPYKKLRVVGLGEWLKGAVEREDTFRTIFVMFIEDDGEETGAADVFVDGVQKATLEGYSVTGWGRRMVRLVAEGLEEKRHHVKICMAKGSEGKTIRLEGLGLC